MKYIRRDRFGAFDLTEYETYLEQEFERLKALVGGDILAIDRFVPSGPRCLHDARFEAFSAVSESDGIAVELCLKGPFFDRLFKLRYQCVTDVAFQLPKPGADLSMHEVRHEGDLLVHEIHFTGGASVEIACARLLFEEVLREPP